MEEKAMSLTILLGCGVAIYVRARSCHWGVSDSDHVGERNDDEERTQWPRSPRQKVICGDEAPAVGSNNIMETRAYLRCLWRPSRLHRGEACESSSIVYDFAGWGYR
jgi:hypothetical protein